MKYLNFKKISERREVSFDARFIFQGQEFYMLQRLENLFYLAFFCCKHIEQKTDFLKYVLMSCYKLQNPSLNSSANMFFKNRPGNV